MDQANSAVATASYRRPWATYVLGPILLLLGALMTFGGGKLAYLGGSLYYLPAGLWLIMAGVALLRRYRHGLIAYTIFLVVTAIWSFWEVGASIWLLLPRLAGPLVVFALLLLGALFVPGRRPKAGAVATGVAASALLLVAGGVGLERSTGEAQAQSPPPPPASAAADWTAYGAGPGGQRYSPAGQITPQNVKNLKIAWTYRTGEVVPKGYRFEVTPLKVGDTLYFCAPSTRIIALDVETGAQRWAYDPQVKGEAAKNRPCRGVSYWAASDPAKTPICPRRIFGTTLDGRLIAVDAATGRPCEDFGDKGQVDLKRGMGPVMPDQYWSSSPPAVGRDVIVAGGRVRDGYSTDMPSGVIRGFDVRTGKLLWNWDAGRPDDTAPLAEGQTYTRSSPNSWAPASVDEILGLVFVPMGNGKIDFWGGVRDPVMERFSSSIVALDLMTGKLRWVRQTVHHDIWDYDIPSQPTLVDLRRNGQVVPAVFAPTKQGDIYVLDRRTGEPIVPVREKPVPQGAAPGDWTSKTQPFSDLTFAPPKLREADMWGVSPLDQLWCRIEFRRARFEGIYTPMREGRTIFSPGNNGIFNWGGAAVDEKRGIAFLNGQFVPFYMELIPRAKADPEMLNPQFGVPYATDAKPFLSPLGIPCSAPPWGEVMGVDLNTMKPIWRKPFGTTQDRALFGISLPLGLPNIGGSAMTAGGLAFIGASADDYIRAYDVRNGRELWRGRLPAGGQATPISYTSTASGRQFVVIAAGGHSYVGSTRGDYVIAYSLPKRP